MADSVEEFEPLFDYTRVQPFNVVHLDDDPFDCPAIGCKKRQKIGDTAVQKNGEKEKVIQIIDCDDDKKEEEEEEEDWMPPPPKITTDTSKLNEDSVMKELRLKKQELASLTQSAEDVLQAVEDSVRQELAAEFMKSDLNAQKQSPTGGAEVQPSKPPQDRAKIIISIQGKDGTRQFKVFMDDKFERLFKAYADKIKLDLQNLVFSFDGDKISPTATPTDLGMEDDDIIEVHVKKN